MSGRIGRAPSSVFDTSGEDTSTRAAVLRASSDLEERGVGSGTRGATRAGVGRGRGAALIATVDVARVAGTRGVTGVRGLLAATRVCVARPSRRFHADGTGRARWVEDRRGCIASHGGYPPPWGPSPRVVARPRMIVPRPRRPAGRDTTAMTRAPVHPNLNLSADRLWLCRLPPPAARLAGVHRPASRPARRTIRRIGAQRAPSAPHDTARAASWRMAASSGRAR